MEEGTNGAGRRCTTRDEREPGDGRNACQNAKSVAGDEAERVTASGYDVAPSPVLPPPPFPPPHTLPSTATLGVRPLWLSSLLTICFSRFRLAPRSCAQGEIPRLSGEKAKGKKK
ncbi:hypothetical protein HPB48_002774 [Haemaphysalis longicornis]|uniref:Uncharacterized protein n=1 Tax=Haemaphysalis longicornis TaxID=44386 RepID=A0A9J6GQM8_HAELO|nr:hypothetical protein HPB48_002774 [Haemaphysalis longicornis]